MKRREFIRRLSVLLAGVPLTGPAIAARKATPVTASMRGWLAYLKQHPGAYHLGATCLRDGKVEQSPAALEAELEATLGHPPHTIVEAQRRLRAEVEREFAAREWLQVEGWWLSRTEARLYALASLIH